MPTRVSYARHPVPAVAAPVIVRLGQQLRISWPAILRRLEHVYLSCERRVQVPDVHAPVVAPAVHIPAIRAPWGTEVAPDQRLEDLMPAERDKRAVVGMRSEVCRVVGIGAVLEARCVLVRIDAVRFLFAHHLAQIPQFGGLVFAVGQHVAPVAFAVDVRQTLGVAKEYAGFAAVTHRTPVPDFEGSVVGAGVEDVWGLGVAEAHGVDVVFMSGDPQHGLSPLDVVHVDAVVACSGDEFSTIA